MSRATVCAHGYWLAECVLCRKRPGECDFGSCTKPFVVTFKFGVERRNCCAAHVRPMIQTSAPRAIVASGENDERETS